MKKNIYFHDFRRELWPSLDELAPYFLAPDGSRWVRGGNDSWGIGVQGLEGTEHLPFSRGRKDINLTMWGGPGVGVLLIYHKIGPVGFRDAYSSKGDMSRIREWVDSLHEDPLPVGLFIPFDKAWLAVKEFMETEGQLPTSIEWVRNHDLPPNTFPSP
jgi:Immunity protein Imm1